MWAWSLQSHVIVECFANKAAIAMHKTWDQKSLFEQRLLFDEYTRMMEQEASKDMDGVQFLAH